MGLVVFPVEESDAQSLTSADFYWSLWPFNNFSV